MTMSAPRDDLFRMIDLPATEFRVDAAEDGSVGTLVGYAAVFDRDTVIDSWEGKFIERIARGAFKKTLAERGERVKVLFNHGFDPSIGDKPLGKPRDMTERNTGLWTETPLDDTSYNRDLVASLRSGALDGMSFRFSVMDERWEEGEGDKLPVRTLLAVRLYEFGPVTFPAYEATTAGVRSRSMFEAWRASHSEVTTGTGVSIPDAAAAIGTAAMLRSEKELALMADRARRAAAAI